jgi:deoxyhypusine synthase
MTSKRINQLPKVKDIKLQKNITVKELIKQYKESGGFVSKHLAIGYEIFERMIKDKDCIKFLSFPACIIATGLRGVIRDIVKKKLVDVIITTCGTLDHDLARIWRDYYHGSFQADDIELSKKDIHRLGNIFVPRESYGTIIEKKLQEIIPKIYNEVSKKYVKSISTRELVWLLGKHISKEKNAKDSIIYWCYKNNIPVFVPGITDGAVGLQLWMFWQDHKDFKIDIMKDEQELSDIVFNAKRTGALIIGGGISKHHTIWWNQFKDGLDYAIYITTAVEYDGSLSGARTREAISWSKIKEKARHITIEGDATVLLPLLVAGVL